MAGRFPVTAHRFGHGTLIYLEIYLEIYLW